MLLYNIIVFSDFISKVTEIITARNLIATLKYMFSFYLSNIQRCALCREMSFLHL